MERITLTKAQQEIMSEFYSIKPTKVIYNKEQRNVLWKHASNRDRCFDFESLKNKCPAIAHQIQRSYDSGNNIQSAVFSECVYAQTFANMFGLDVFVNCYEESDYIPYLTLDLIKSHDLVPRYVYSTRDKKQMLIQAGGCAGIDSALITVINKTISTIEFKEPGAKTSEADLPKYDEDGNLKVTNTFLKNYPQYASMLEEQKGLNFFDKMGHNINNFSPESVNIAVSNNYMRKSADVICTEDEEGFLVMIPANQVHLWAVTQGEIRPAGRNKCKVWTPVALSHYLFKASINGSKVTINKKELTARKERGGNKRISGYKINPLFFIYLVNCKEMGENLIFDLSDVKQLKPTISAKIFFKNLRYLDLKSFYENYI